MEQIKGYEGLYEIHLDGDVDDPQTEAAVWSCKNEKYLAFGISTNGHLVVVLCKNGVRKTHQIHSLIGGQFMSNPENKPCLDHKNQCKTDNRLGNLRYLTKAENGHNSKAKGYCKHRCGKFVSEIQAHGKKIYLGLFELETDAQKAFEAGSRKYYPGIRYDIEGYLEPPSPT